MTTRFNIVIAVAFSALFGVLMLVAGTEPATAQGQQVMRVNLADGTPIEGGLVRINEEWVEIDREGWRLQLPWWAVDGGNLVEGRKSLVEQGIASSNATFAHWAHWQGLTTIRNEADVTATQLGETPDYARRLPEWYTARLKSIPAVIEKPSETPVGERPGPRQPPKPTANQRQKPETATVSSAVSTGDTKTIADAVTKQLTDDGVKIQSRQPAVTVTVGEVTLTTVRRVTWFGSIHELVKNGSFEIKAVWKDGHEVTHTIKSSDQMTRKSDAEVDEKVRKDLLQKTKSWISREVLGG